MREHECEYKQAVFSLTSQVEALLAEVSSLRNELASYQAELVACKNELASCQAELATCKNELAECKEKLAKYEQPPKDSSNSSKPPSTDLSRKRRYPDREKSEKKTGGQPGHPGHTHPFSETPDIVLECPAPSQCPHCHSPEMIPIEEIERRQVVDIPEPRIEVTEYHSKRAQCQCCGKIAKGAFPPGVEAHVQIGQRAQSLAILLKAEHALSDARVVSFLVDVFGLCISEGWVENTVTNKAKHFQATVESILSAIVASDVVGSDETGNYISAKRVWTWVFQTLSLVYFTTIASRGFKVIQSLIGKTFSGTWVSDRLGSQLKLVADFNQWCLAHIIRECRYLIQVEDSVWATQLKEILCEAIAFRNQYGEEYDPHSYRSEILLFESRLAACFNLPLPDCPKGKAIFGKLKLGQDRMLRFLHDPRVPPTNNDSERPLRHWALLKKVFGGFRTFEGVHRYDILLSIIQTAKRQGLNVLHVLSGSIQLSIPAIPS
jgi:transposase